MVTSNNIVHAEPFASPSVPAPCLPDFLTHTRPRNVRYHNWRVMASAGNYPLHMACMFSRTEVVGALLRSEADMAMKNAAGELPSRLASVSLRMKMEAFRDTGTFG